MAGFEEARARRALEGAGLDMMMPLQRASSVTNEVWVGEEYVIRVNRRPDQRLRREAMLAPLLPPEIGYPEVVAYGGQLGADWFVCRRVPGLVLSRCWPGMARGERREVVRQFAAGLRALHAFTFPGDLPETVSPQLLGGSGAFSPTEPLVAALAEARQLEHVDSGVVGLAERIVRDTAYALDPWESTTTVHGDLHFENVLWDGTAITALLDFEYARPGPPDLDLDVFLRFCAYPFLHVAEDYEHLTLAADYVEVPFWLAEDYPELFAHPHQFERLRLYCIAYDVRELLLFPPQRRPRDLSEHHPYNRLLRTVSGDGHLDRLHARHELNAG
jgi:aminoglycoside phosphotransferase (APT) family kinase protein